MGKQCTNYLLHSNTIKPVASQNKPLIIFFYIYIDESEDGSIENLIRKLYIPLIYQLKGAIVNLFSKEERSLPFMLKSSLGKPQCIALTLQNIRKLQKKGVSNFFIPPPPF